MRKIFAMLVAMLLIMNMLFTTAFATGNITIDTPVFDSDTKTYTISGVVNSTRNRIPMTLIVKHQDGTVLDVVETLATERITNGVKFTFGAVGISPLVLSGNVTFEVVAAYLNYSGTATDYYNGVDQYYTALKTVKDAIDNAGGVINSTNENALKTAINTTKAVLGVDEAALLALTDDAASFSDSQSIALRNLFLLALDLPTGASDADCYDAPEECEQIAAQVEVYQDRFKEAIVLGSFFEASTSQALKSWYDANKVKYSLETTETAVDDTKLITYFEEAILADAFASRKDNIRFVSTMAELNYEMKKQAVLQIIEDSGQDAVSRVLTELGPMLSNVNDANGLNPVSVNYYLWNNLSADDKSTVCVNLARRDYADIYSFINDVNLEINNRLLNNTPPVYEETTTTDRGNGGSSRPVAVPIETVETAPVMEFKDIGHVAWAETPIRYLYSNGIITGRSEDTFDPDNKVTRAELAKMLVLGFGLKGDSGASFSDVPSGAWYAEYVKAAAANGLILGDDSGRFNPNQPVSRQDAAVMMYRAIKLDSQAEAADFEDYSKISSYARDAIDYMYEQGIVGGVGDGYFAPLANVTRAQSAKMLYMLLIN